MSFTLFGPESGWDRILNDEPVVDGVHPANLYLGYLAAKGRLERGTDCCYDPAFQAGYPRTPILNGSRLAEVFSLAAGGNYSPQAYKMGLFTVSLLAPLFLFLAAWSANGCSGTALLAAAAGLFAWWGQPTQIAFRTGDIELLLAGLAVLLHASLLVRFHHAPGFGCWFGLLLSGVIGWLAQPLLVLLFLPLWLIYYLTVGAKHPALTWHLALLGVQLGAIALNLFWLIDWVVFWWLRSPLPQAPGLLPHRTLQTLWEAPLWGDGADRLGAILMLGSAVVGSWWMNQTRQRAAARLLGLGAGGLIVLTLLGLVWDPVGRMGTAALLSPALFFAAVPAAHGWVQTHRWLSQRVGTWKTVAAELCLLAGAGTYAHSSFPALAERLQHAEPLSIGLGAKREALVQQLVQYTGADARILWECLPQPRTAAHWTPLLPLLTERSFIGGLDPDASMEHGAIGLIDHALNGRHISTWSSPALEEYCRLYNIGWIACWSSPVVNRMQKWQGATLVCTLDGDSPGFLFAVRQHVPSYTLKGQARVVHADSHHITLADVIPEKNGEVLLSLHYQRGMRALPSRVQVECGGDAYDPIGFLRLKVAGPVSRVTLTWDCR